MNISLEHLPLWIEKNMPLEYESLDFSEELKRRINSNKEYREKAKDMNLKTLIIVNDVPFATYSSYANGVIEERKQIPQSEIEEYRKKADFIVEIPTYALSVEMAKGRESLESLFLSGTLKVEGSIFKALQYRDALESLGKMTAALVNESSIPSKEEFVRMLRERELL